MMFSRSYSRNLDGITPHFFKIVIINKQMNIPRIIHQIWFQGESEIPPHLQEYRNTWIKIHPEYEIKLWDQKLIDILLEQIDLVWLSKLYYSY